MGQIDAAGRALTVTVKGLAVAVESGARAFSVYSPIRTLKEFKLPLLSVLVWR
jgi:hypothetical protein